ncbi:M48 family metalloprotease [Variovorax sp. HJSM1_2]|uniref:M48 family metalloprotease n=1 Tax=Variovorax sp. HJSM1_2 TaxID=3366263 RepID=UPI003BDA6410
MPAHGFNLKKHTSKKPVTLVQKAVLATLLLANLTFGVIPGWAQSRQQLPTLGDSSELASAAERRIGESIARQIYRDPAYLDDAVLSEYIQSLWQPLLDAARARGELSEELEQRFAWEIMIGRDREINAFALPGGYLGVYLGLIGLVSSSDELASVLAHELSHVTQRHISRLMTQQSQQMPLMLAALVLGALVLGKSADAGNALIVGGQAVATQNQLNFSRDMEREADRVGFGVMTQAGYDPKAFVSMFEKLQQASRLNDNGSFPYLRSHPLTTERISDMQSRQLLDAPKNLPPKPPDFYQAMMAARARVLSRPGPDALRSWIADGNLVATKEKELNYASAGVLYAAALGALQLREIDTARRLASVLLQQSAATPKPYRVAKMLAAEIEWAAGDVKAAAALVDADAPGRPELIIGSQLRIRSGQARQAITRLQPWVSTHPRDAAAWQLLSNAYDAQGQTLRALRAEAEVQVARLDYSGALDRFKAAQDFVRKPPPGSGPVDDIEASIIDARTREVLAKLKEQAKDEKEMR